MYEITAEEYEVVKYGLDSFYIEGIFGPFETEHDAYKWIKGQVEFDMFNPDYFKIKDSYRIIHRTRLAKSNV